MRLTGWSDKWVSISESHACGHDRAMLATMKMTFARRESGTIRGMAFVAELAVNILCDVIPGLAGLDQFDADPLPNNSGQQCF